MWLPSWHSDMLFITGLSQWLVLNTLFCGLLIRKRVKWQNTKWKNNGSDSHSPNWNLTICWLTQRFVYVWFKKSYNLMWIIKLSFIAAGNILSCKCWMESKYKGKSYYFNKKNSKNNYFKSKLIILKWEEKYFIDGELIDSQ